MGGVRTATLPTAINDGNALSQRARERFDRTRSFRYGLNDGARVRETLRR